MCENGVNTDQMRLMIGQVGDSLGVSQQSLEQIHHLADHASLHDPSATVAQASVLLGEARAKLESAMEELSGHSDGDVTVERV
jgi:hypothetical protein